MTTETPLIIETATTGNEIEIALSRQRNLATIAPETLNFAVGLSEGHNSITMAFEDSDRIYFEGDKYKLNSILNKIISNLLRSRDFIGLQLNLEFGNITDEQYERLELDYLSEPQDIDISVLKSDINVLMWLSNKIFNAEEISTMFNCSLDKAEKAIDLILLELENK